MLIEAAIVGQVLGHTDRAVRKRAAREGWPYQERPVRGGRKRFYPLATLPADVRAAVEAHLAAQAAARVAPPSGTAGADPGVTGADAPPAASSVVPASTSAPVGGVAASAAPAASAVVAATLNVRPSAAAAAEAERRWRILAPVLDGRTHGRAAIAAHAAAHGVTASTLYRWLAAYRRGGMAALMPSPRRDAGKARVLISAAIDRALAAAGVPPERQAQLAAEIVPIIRGLWAQQGLRSWRQVRELARPVVADKLIAAGVPEREARRIDRLGRRLIDGERRFALIALAERDAKGFYDRVSTSIRRSRRELRPGEVVFGDVSPADIPVRRPDGAIVYARLIAWRDAATNMMHVTGFVADKGQAVRREHVALAFARMCEEAPWGLPQRLYLDRGAEFSWPQMFSAWRDLARLSGGRFVGAYADDALDDVGRVWRSEPFRPRAKLIEGGFAQLLWCLSWHPSFAGSDRLVKKTRALGRPVEPTTLPDLKRMIADAIGYYHALPQDGHLDGRSPAEAMAEWQQRGFAPTHVAPDVLAFAFGETVSRRVVQGCVVCEGVRYYHPELVAWTGEAIPVRWARHAPEYAIALHPRTGTVLCVAAPLPTYDFADPEGARAAARLQAAARKAVSVLKGQVAWLDPRDLMREVAAMGGVSEVIAEGERRRRTITLSPEAAALLEASRAAIAEAAQAAAAPAAAPPRLSQWRAEMERSPLHEAIEAWLDGRGERPEMPPLPEQGGAEEDWPVPMAAGRMAQGEIR